MAFQEKQVPADASAAQKLMAWVDSRLPVTEAFKRHMSEYYAPKNLNFFYIFGALAIVVLVNQILTGIFLTMNYKPDAAKAFESVEYIMREVPWGWMIRYMHSTGASMFFVVVYMHMFRGLIYGSYRKPRELIWIFGCAIFLCLMGEAFFGYLLPWGQMSYWGAQVIVNLFSAIPFIGPDLSLWLRGDYVVGDATLNRFFAFHVIAIPLVLVGLVAAHILALHEVGSNNPDGVEIKENLDANGHPVDGIPFHPFYSVHDVMYLGGFLLILQASYFLLQRWADTSLKQIISSLQTHSKPLRILRQFGTSRRFTQCCVQPLPTSYCHCGFSWPLFLDCLLKIQKTLRSKESVSLLLLY